MLNIIVKKYFLAEIERDRIEGDILNCTLGNEEDIAELDDREIVELFNKYVKEQSLN